MSRGSNAGRLFLRCLILVAAWWVASVPHNPIVRLEASVGLSPSPLEKLFNIKGPFSGMTEGMHQLARGRPAAALESNVLTPFVAAGFAVCVLLGVRPRITTRRREVAFFASVIAATVLVNWFP
jgi:hypothetical protein